MGEEGAVMGVVPMELSDFVLSRGYPFNTTAVYIYCDNCGSFSVKKYINLRRWLIIACCTVVVAIICRQFVLGRTIGTSELTLYGGIAFVTAVLTIKYWGFPGYRCRKCGSVTTTRYNTRGCHSDKSIVDVPDSMVQKYYLSNWPDLCDLNDYLKPP